ncbi:MAG: ImmA/IrrE family metallo-endopeptidase [Microbacteriaceae bacterium]|nr:ImmA/IrrE family metallo-endopeptidase [Microbacteriaceae bacterium]
MRRGFKTEARALALEVRAEVGIDAFQAFDPRALASLYGITIVAVSDAERDLSETRDSAQFSGALIPVGTGTVILENDHHSSTRARLTLSHEMSHVVLEHRFGTSLVDEKGCRDADGNQEAEANELAGELVLPFDGALRLAWNRVADSDVAVRYAISEAAARWRMNASGVRTIVTRTLNARARAR